MLGKKGEHTQQASLLKRLRRAAKQQVRARIAVAFVARCDHQR